MKFYFFLNIVQIIQRYTNFMVGAENDLWCQIQKWQILKVAMKKWLLVTKCSFMLLGCKHCY